MSEHHAEIIIIKRKGGHGAGHHGGAWKIAFADFMTAMMAFFLVLWIINATDKDTKAVIARYFNPTKLENPARARKGVHGVDDSKIVSNETSGEQTPDQLPPETPASKDDKSKNDKASDKKGAADAAAPSIGTPPKKDEKPKTAAAVPHPESKNLVDVKPTMSETALFSDPYRALEKIVGGRSGDDATPPGPETGSADPQRLAGGGSVEAFRDPFKPIGPGEPNDQVSLDSDTPPPPPPEARPDAVPQANAAAPPPPTAAAPTEAAKPPDVATAPPPPPPSPTASATPTAVAAPAADAAKAPPTGKPADLLKELRDKLGAQQAAGAGPGVVVEATKEGLLVSLTDKLNFSMFAVGSAEPRPEVIKAMETIANVLKARNESLIVRGHTDSRPYKNGAVYDNWRLSSDRAQMAYYMLTRAGVPAGRFERIEGHADHALRDPAHPTAAENRRIEILVRETKP